MAYSPPNSFNPVTSTRDIVDHHHRSLSPIIHPQRILESIERERPAMGRANSWLADHIVGIAGTMAFFYFLLLGIASWSAWQSAFDRNKGFDPFPYAFLFFVLGGIMQSLFVPTMLVTSNRAAARERIKDEADHRAWTHLYEVNEEQIRILRALAAELLPASPTGTAGSDVVGE